MTATIDALQKTALFSTLGRKHLDLVAAMANTVSVDKGTVLTTQDRPVTHMSIILSGAATVEHDGATVATLGPEAAIGEFAMVDGQPASATVTITEPSEVLSLAKAGFVVMWDKNPDMSKAMLEAVVAKLRETNALLAE